MHNKSEALMIKNVPETAQVKKKVFVKIGRPGELERSQLQASGRTCLGNRELGEI